MIQKPMPNFHRTYLTFYLQNNLNGRKVSVYNGNTIIGDPLLLAKNSSILLVVVEPVLLQVKLIGTGTYLTNSFLL